MRLARSATDADPKPLKGFAAFWASTRVWGIAVPVLVLLLVLVAGQRAYAWKEINDRDQERRDALNAAQAEVVGLISISSTTSDGDITALLDGATAAFREELQSQADRLRTELQANEVEASGEVVSAALSAFEDGTATVIVAAAGSVDNKQTAEPEPRNYRLEVKLVMEGDRWLVSGLEFVA